MRRLLKWLGWSVAVLALVPVLFIVSTLIAANTDPGRHLIEYLSARFTGGMVRINGFDGRFPDAIRIGRLEVADDAGIYVALEDVTLDWDPLALIHGQVSIDLLEANRVALTRLPRSSSNEGGGGVPAIRLVLRRLHLSRLEIGSAVAGQPAVLAVDGAAEVVAQDIAHVSLSITSEARHEGTDRYTIEASMDQSRIHAKLGVTEAANGLIARVTQLPDLGSISIGASIDGPMAALKASATIAAGSLRANVAGTLDAVGKTADLTASASAPAMTPAPDVSWSSIHFAVHVRGPFTRPDVVGTLTIDKLVAGVAGIGLLQADISGNAGQVELHARLNELRVPGPMPELMAGGPMTLDATARLDTPNRPVQFSVRHALLSADGTANAGDAMQAQIKLTIPDLAPLAAIGGPVLEGGIVLDVDAAQAKDITTINANASVNITGGQTQVATMVGDTGTIELAASVRGSDVHLSRFEMNGKAFNASATGEFVNNQLGLNWMLRFADLTATQPNVSGAVDMRGRLSGTLSDLSLTSDVSGDVAAEGYSSGRFTAHLVANGLPDAPRVRLTVDGAVLDSPLALAIAAERRDGAFHVAIERGTWKSLTAAGSLDLAAGAILPTGSIRLAIAHLEDLAPLLGRPITGSVSATLDGESGSARIGVSATRIAMPGTATVAAMGLNVTITDLTDHPVVDGTLTMDGASLGGMRASARLTARGHVNAIGLILTTDVSDVAGAPARVETSGTLDTIARTFLLTSLRGVWKQEAIRLLAPAKVSFAEDLVLDRLRLGLRQAELEVTGRAGAVLDLKLNLRNLPADFVAVVAPEYAANGTITADARLTGTVARPAGTVRINATGLRMRAGPGQALPSAAVTVNATLSGGNVRLDSHLVAGASNITLNGSAGMGGSSRMDLRVGGTLYLAMLDPLLAAQGRRVRGRLNLALGLGGTLLTPLASGTVRLSGGDVQDYARGAHISDVTATIQADGETIRLTEFNGKAGPGTVTGSGTLGLSGARPIQMTLRASNARPLSTDLVSALLDANLLLSGTLNGDMALSGTVTVRRADIRVPEKLPSSIAVLQVRNAGTRWVPPKPQPPPPGVTLNLTLDAPNQVFVRGRGLDAELGGRVLFTGTAMNPVPQGGIRLRRGTMSVVGQTLGLTEGIIDFSGGGLSDPSLKFVATSRSAALTANVTVSGRVRDPKITLSSAPDLPQDEILAQVLFNTTKSRLGPFQIAQIAAALASLSGTTSSFGDPLDSVRSTLGLDRLSVGSGSGGTPMLEAGRYLAPGVYIGAKQSATGNGTQATVQIDIAKGLKLETTVGTGSASATGGAGSADAASVGVTYQLEY